MRSFIPALVLFLMLGVFCGVYTKASDSFITEIYDCTQKIEKNRFDDFENASLLRQLEDVFYSKEKFFMPFMNHDILDDTKEHIMRAKMLYTLGNEDLFKLEICTLKTHLSDILDEQKATFSNILKKR